MPLHKLPTEMLEAITHHLDLDTFRSLRLVSPSVNQQSLHQFKDRFFRQRTLRWDKSSFQSLLDITLDVYFGSALQNLIIDATPHDAIRLWELKTHIEELPGPHNFHNEVMKLYKSLRYEAEDHAKYWVETRLDIKTLTTVFEMRKSTGLKKIVFAYDGMVKKYGKFARQYCENSQNEMSGPFVATMTAIAQSGIAVEEISIHKERKYGAVSIGRLEQISRFLRQLDTPFEVLRTLKVNLRDWRHPEEGFALEGNKAPLVVRFLAKCKNMKELELSCFSSLEGDLMSEIAKHCHFPQMESCKVELFRISNINDLFAFLAHAKKTLRNLSLSHIVLRDDTASWADVMRRIATELDLESLELLNMFGRMGARVGIDGMFKGSLIVIGAKMKEELERSADNLVSGNWGPAWHLAATSYPFIGLRT